MRAAPEGALFNYADFPDRDLAERHRIGDAALVNVDHPLGDKLTNRILTIRKAEPAQRVVERELKNVPLLRRKITV